MNEKITQPRLVTLLAEASGISKRQAEEFIKAFLSTLIDEISVRNSVKIKGFGSFKVSKMGARKSVNVSTGEAVEIPPHYKVSFVPDKAVAAQINAPFDMFETIELEDDVEDEELQAITDEFEVAAVEIPPLSENEILAPQPSPVVIEVGEEEFDSARDEDTEILPLIAESTASEESVEEQREKAQELGEKLEEDFGPIGPAEPFGPIDPDDSRSGDMNSDSQQEEKQLSHKKEVEVSQDLLRKHSFNKGLILGIVATFIVMILGFGALYYLMMNKIDALWAKGNQEKEETEVVMITSNPISQPSNTDIDEDVKQKNDNQEEDFNKNLAREEKEAEVAKSEEIAKKKEPGKKETVAVTPQSDQPKYDTISKTRFLTTMAKEYYGNYHLWPYIYKENEDILGHPDRIRPGTKVKIPDLAKYNVSASNPVDIKKAKEMGVQIYKRYQ